MKHLKTFERYTTQNFPDLYDGQIGQEPIISIPIDYYQPVEDEETEDEEGEDKIKDLYYGTLPNFKRFKKRKQKISAE